MQKTNMAKKIIAWVCVLVCLATAGTAVIPIDTLDHFFNFDNAYTVGNTTVDYENRFNGTNNGSTTGVAGKIGECYDYDGTGDNVYFGPDGWGDWNNESLTVYFWFNSNIIEDNRAPIGYVGTAAGGQLAVQQETTGTSLDLQIYSNGWDSWGDVAQSITANRWIMFLYTCNATHSWLYINGTLANSSAIGCPNGDAGRAGGCGAPPYLNLGEFCEFGGPQNFNGSIDEFGVWNETFTDTLVTELYNNYNGLPRSQFGATPTTDIDITVTDQFNASSINTFAVNITWPNASTTTHATTNGTVSLVNVSNGSIDVLFWNVTDYYNLVLYSEAVAVNTTTSISAEMYQAVITLAATEKISGSTLTSVLYYTGSVSGTEFNITAGSHNITAEKTGYYNQTQQISVTAQTNTTKTITGLFSALWNITVYNHITHAVITSYEINISSLNYTWAGENSTSTTGSYNFSGINGTFQAVIDAAGYAPQTFNFSINATTGAVNFSLYTTNSINFSIYDEETEQLLVGYNVSLELIGNTQAYNFSTMNGTLYVDLLAPQNYLIRYSDTNGSYAERFYFFNLTNRTNNAIDLYLLNETHTDYADITATVYDETNHFIEGAIIKVLRYYLSTNSYVIVEMARTNFEGVTTLHLLQNNEFYEFVIEYPQGVTKKITTPTQIYGDTINFQILLATATGTRYYNSLGVETDLYFDEANNRFRLYWNDATNTLSQICLHTDLLTRFRNETVNRTCSTSTTGIMYHAVTNVTGRTYQARALAYFSEPPATLASIYHTYVATNPIGTIGLVLVILLTVIFACIGAWNLATGVILTPLPALFASIAGIIPIPAYVTIPLELVAVIIAYVISTRA